MHWVIQKSLFKPGNFELLISALERAAIEFSVVSITPKTYEISPDLSIAGPVFVCGAIRLKAVAENKGWKPGSFLNENFSFDIWKEKLGTELLNSDTTVGTLRNIDVPLDESFFIRPLEDNKAFDGMVIDKETLDDWRRDKRKQSLMGLDVIVSTVKQIYREYRIFVVAGKAITGSTYKVGRRAEISELIDEDVYNYVETIIQKWAPAASFVIDVSLGPDGLKVIEFNNINSSGFYAVNMDKYVQAIQAAYSTS